MSALEKLTPKLLSIAPEDLLFPDKPIPVALQEAHDLATYLGNPEHASILERLLAVGLPKAELSALKKAIDGTREAQSAWVVARDRTKSDAQKKREEDGVALRSDIVAAVRWNLRDDRVAQATTDVIQEGDGVEDLVQDLVDLAALLERHEEAFEPDETFDAAEIAERARSTAGAIRAGLSEARTDRTPSDAKLLRDRAFTYMQARVRAIREAGRYAFRKEPTIKARFGSLYERTQRRRQRAVAAEPEIDPTTPAPAVEPVPVA